MHELSTQCPLLQQLRQTRQASLQSSSFRSWRRCREKWTASRAYRGKAGGLGDGVREREREPVRCHRCQEPGHIARYCRAPPPIPAGRRQSSVTASPALEIDARESAAPTVAVEFDKRSNRVGRKGALSLTDTSSNAAAMSQVSSCKPRGQRRRARRNTASPRSPDEVQDAEDAETGCVAVACHRPTNEWNLWSRVSGSQLWSGHRRLLSYVMPHNKSLHLVCLLEVSESLT